ncbi:MAG: hypothetical protein JF888_00545 [Candidatus Dormibacteraeota bacterium]|uniref:Uncharacterized protein n=1 Tax=Candidatus Dormiibacter inghamiae TaxID=3127013 RepID=A0A934KE57_9BACT|nr:hypothetical protein [Candidatus Dormibacteraeota bacterium]MBJ7607749.1 hypothetical protein [Candidatus Dormibacteraeota bacterium]
MAPQTPTGSDYVQELVIGFAAWASASARAGLASLLQSFGDSTEPDYLAIVPVYNRMLAIALLVVGAVIAIGLIERILGGQMGLSWNLVPRVLIAVFFAFSGFSLVQYLSGYAALLATAWSPDLAQYAKSLTDPASFEHLSRNASAGTLGALIFTALLTILMAVLVHLELLIRAALMLTVTAFIPLVCVLAIWPRMTAAAIHLAEFLVGLMLSKFVVATVIYIGFGLVIPAMHGAQSADGKAGWLSTGLAILLIATFSPAILFQALRFAHGGAGGMVRGWGAGVVSMMTMGSVVRLASGVGRRGLTRVRQAVSMARSRGSTTSSSRGPDS